MEPRVTVAAYELVARLSVHIPQRLSDPEVRKSSEVAAFNDRPSVPYGAIGPCARDQAHVCRTRPGLLRIEHFAGAFMFFRVK